MALIQKYNSGGSFKNYVESKILSDPNSMSTKDQQNILDKLNEDTFNPELSDNKKIQKLYGEFKTQSPKYKEVDLTGGIKANRRVGSLLDHITEDYKGNKDYALRSIAEMSYDKEGNPTNKNIQKYLIEKSKDLASKYIDAKLRDTEGSNWKDYDLVSSLSSVINQIDPDNFSDDDWKKVVNFTDSLGWQISDFLVRPEELAQLKQNVEQQRAVDKQEEIKKNATSIYDQFGVSDEYRDGLIQAGYSKVNTDLHPNLAEHFKEKNYTAFTDGTNNLVWDGKGWVESDSGALTYDRFSDDYLKTFKIDKGGLQVFEADQIPSDFTPKDMEDEGNIQLKLTPKEEIQGFPSSEWDIIGDSNDNQQGQFARDRFGRRDYTAGLTFVNKNTKKTQRAIKQSDDSYKFNDGKILRNISFSAGESAGEIPIDYMRALWNNPQYEKLSGLKQRSTESRLGRWGITKDYDVERVKEEINKVHKIIEEAKTAGEAPDFDLDRYRKMVAHLKDFAAKGKLSEEDHNLFTAINSYISPDYYGNIIIPNFKIGGIISAQKGSILQQIVEDNKKYAKQVPQTSDGQDYSQYVDSNKKTPKQQIDTSDTVGKMNTLQAISLAGSVGSFIPGFGAIGGAVSTVADAVDGARDGWDKQDWVNLGTNLGFTGLSLIGLGALKGVKIGNTALKGARAVKKGKQASKILSTAKAARYGEKAVEAAKKVEKLENALPSGKILTKVLKGSETLSSSQLGKISKAAKDAGYAVTDGMDVAQILGLASKDMQIVSQIAKAPTNIAQGAWQAAGRGIMASLDKGKKAIPMALAANQVYQGGAGAVNIGKNIREEGDIWEGIKSSKVSDVRSVAQLGAFGLGSYKNRVNKKAYMNNTNPSEVTEATYGIKVGDGKSYKTKIDINAPEEGVKTSLTDKLTKTLKNTQTKFNNAKATPREKVAIRAEAKKELEETLKGILVDPNQKDIKEIVNAVLKEGKKIKVDKNLTKEAVESAFRVMKVDPNSYDAKDLSEFRRATKIDNSGARSANYFLPQRFRWYPSSSGVRKGSTGFKFTLPEIDLNLPQLKPNLLYNKYKPKSFDKESLYRSIMPTSNPIKYGKDYKLDLKPSLEPQNTNSTLSNMGKLPVVNLETFKNSKRFDSYPATQAIKLALAEGGNREAIGHLLNAAAKIPKLTGMSNTHLRVSTPYSMMASSQAGKMRSLGNRMANSTTDLNIGIGSRLQAEKQAVDIEREAQGKDIELKQKINDRQSYLDSNVARFNTEIANKTSALGADAGSKMSQLMANSAIQSAGNKSGFVSAMQNWMDTKGQKDAEHRYRDEIFNNPNIQIVDDYMAKVVDSKQQFLDGYNADKGVKFSDDVSFEESPYGKTYLDFYKNAVNTYRNPLNNRINRLARAANMGYSGYYAKGGKLSEKEAIAIEKENSKKIEKHQDRVLKSVLNNSKLIEKALIKVFK